uniref:Uncharacterized protein n=1 Tax=viral metagenome TaxID=1070528 RepID=A0A6C0EC66_9ZZZZ
MKCFTWFVGRKSRKIHDKLMKFTDKNVLFSRVEVSDNKKTKVIVGCLSAHSKDIEDKLRKYFKDDNVELSVQVVNNRSV